MLAQLESRLRAYAKHLPENSRIVVAVDQDKESCRELKRRLERMAANAGVRTRSGTGGKAWQLVNRIVIEELEAWYFGDWEAVRRAYPRMPRGIPRKAPYRIPDAIPDTWEAFQRIGQGCGYFKSGLSKIEAARAIAPHINPERNDSLSFKNFFKVLVEAGTWPALQ